MATRRVEGGIKDSVPPIFNSSVRQEGFVRGKLSMPSTPSRGSLQENNILTNCARVTERHTHNS